MNMRNVTCAGTQTAKVSILIASVYFLLPGEELDVSADKR